MISQQVKLISLNILEFIVNALFEILLIFFVNLVDRSLEQLPH